MLALNFGFWEFWETYPQKVIFDGVNRIILINQNETDIDIRVDVYSNWKEWVKYRDNSQYSQAMSSIGGDLTPTGSIGGTYFLENGWKIKPWAGNYKLSIFGNLYSRDGSDPFIEATGSSYKVTITQSVSNIVDQTQTPTAADIAAQVRVELANELGIITGGIVGGGMTEVELHQWLDSYLNKADWQTSEVDFHDFLDTYVNKDLWQSTASEVELHQWLDSYLNKSDWSSSDKNTEAELHQWLDSYLNKADWKATDVDLSPVINAIAALNDVTPAEVRAAFDPAEFKDKNTQNELHVWLDNYVNKAAWQGLTPTQQATLIDVNQIVSSMQTDVTNMKGTVNTLPTLLDIEGSTVLAKTSDISVVEAIVNGHPTLAQMRDEMINVQFGGLEIANNQMTIKDKAGAVIAIFDLFDKNGNPTMLSVFKRTVAA